MFIWVIKLLTQGLRLFLEFAEYSKSEALKPQQIFTSSYTLKVKHKRTKSRII